MTVNLLLDSDLAKRQRKNANQPSHDFTIYIAPPLVLDPSKSYKSGVEQTNHYQLLLVQHRKSLRKQQTKGILYFADWTRLDWTSKTRTRKNRGLLKRRLVKRNIKFLFI